MKNWTVRKWVCVSLGIGPCIRVIEASRVTNDTARASTRERFNLTRYAIWSVFRDKYTPGKELTSDSRRNVVGLP